MVKEPCFKLIVNNNDITEAIKTNLSSISFKDEANNKADEITVATTGKIARPKYKDEIKLYLGYDNEVSFVGLFLVQTTARQNNYGLTIQATSVDFTNTLKQKRNITYEKLSVYAICEQISKRNNLELKCDLNKVYFASIAQQDESDLNFLDRLAKDLNAIFNIKNNTLIFIEKVKDDKKNEELPNYTISLKNNTTSNISHSNKTLYNSCKAVWHDTQENKTMEIVVGSGEPVYLLKGSFKNAAEAKIKAAAKLQTANQGIVTGTIGISGQIIFAGGILNIVDSLEDDGEYQITSVDHTFDSSGWKTNINFER